MSNADKILEVLGQANGVLCDDCISRIANIFPRQQVNAVAARLLGAGRIIRKDDLTCGNCGRVKKGSASLNGPSVRPREPSGETDKTAQLIEASKVVRPVVHSHKALSTGEPHSGRPWHWEGNVQIALRDYLVRQGWAITHFANTERKESGIDLGAAKGSREILFEVKGYPTTVYDYGPNLGKAKPTVPSSQARQWYSHAMLGIMRMREKYPTKEIALCFPDFPTYRRLIDGTRTSLQLLDIAVYIVMEDRHVSVLIDRRCAERE